MRIAIGSDHAGFVMKKKLREWLTQPDAGGHRVEDLGCFQEESCDYPDFARAVGRAVARGRASRGILLCGTGIGMAMAANKVRGVRAAVAWTPATAALAAEHNHANVLCVPARLASWPAVRAMVRAFLETPHGGGRHQRRVAKIHALERECCRARKNRGGSYE